MLTLEFDLDIAKKIWREEALEEGMEKGMEKGIEKGIEKGMEKGIEKGIEKGLILTAKKLLSRNVPLDEVVEITGLAYEKVADLYSL
jgi:predicted transposase/invertase (TIGR01784 family)